MSQEGIRLFLDDPEVKVDIYDELESSGNTLDYHLLSEIVRGADGAYCQQEESWTGYPCFM